MEYARGQSLKSRSIKRVLGSRGYELSKAARLAWPLARHSYSQHGEDLAIAGLLTGGNGKYLDIGSGNPVHLSNTYSLYRAGWSGVLVDPLWANATLSRLLRPRDEFVRAVATSEKGITDFYEVDPSFYSTTDPEVAARVVTSGAVIERVSRLECIPVRELNFRVTPLEPSVISLDVEGHELPVLNSIDWSTQSPQILVIEMWARDESDERNDTIRTMLRDLGYREAAACGADNVVFRHADAT